MASSLEHFDSLGTNLSLPMWDSLDAPLLAGLDDFLDSDFLALLEEDAAEPAAKRPHTAPLQQANQSSAPAPPQVASTTQHQPVTIVRQAAVRRSRAPAPPTTGNSWTVTTTAPPPPAAPSPPEQQPQPSKVVKRRSASPAAEVPSTSSRPVMSLVQPTACTRSNVASPADMEAVAAAVLAVVCPHSTAKHASPVASSANGSQVNNFACSSDDDDDDSDDSNDTEEAMLPSTTGRQEVAEGKKVNKRKAPEVDWRSITDPAERRRQRRLAKNRVTAARSRERKKVQWADMEARMMKIEAQRMEVVAENTTLKAMLEQFARDNEMLRVQLATLAAKGGDPTAPSQSGSHTEPAVLTISIAIMLLMCVILSADAATLPTGCSVPLALLASLAAAASAASSSSSTACSGPEMLVQLLAALKALLQRSARSLKRGMQKAQQFFAERSSGSCSTSSSVIRPSTQPQKLVSQPSCPASSSARQTLSAVCQQWLGSAPSIVAC